MNNIVGVLILVVAIAWLGFQRIQISTTEPTASIEFTGNVAFTDPTPNDVLELEKRIGVFVEYTHGRQVFIDRGNEFSLWWHNPTGDSVLAGADSIVDVVAKFEQRYAEAKRRNFVPIKYGSEEREAAERLRRAAEWDAREPKPEGEFIGGNYIFTNRDYRDEGKSQ